MNMYFIGTCTYQQVANDTPTGWKTVAPPERATYNRHSSDASTTRRSNREQQRADSCYRRTLTFLLLHTIRL